MPVAYLNHLRKVLTTFSRRTVTRRKKETNRRLKTMVMNLREKESPIKYLRRAPMLMIPKNGPQVALGRFDPSTTIMAEVVVVAAFRRILQVV